MADTIAVIFDFDDTLAPDTTSSYLAAIGVDVMRFWQVDVQPLLDDGWDPIPAYLYRMIELSRQAPGAPRITRRSLAAWGRRVRLHHGATRIFERLRSHAAAVNPNVRLAFFVISSGVGEIVRNTRIAKEFDDIWACDFHYGDDDGIVFPKNVVSFTDKTRYLFQIAKGLVGPRFRNRPFDVNRKVQDRERVVPFDQMIFVGDGYTDIPCFSLVKRQGGTAIGVFDPENRAKWGRAWGFIEDGRVSNLVPADYGADSALMYSLKMAVGSVAGRLALRGSTYQG